jgi:hypothetical protein
MIFKQKKGFLLRDFVIVGILFGIIISLYIINVASIANNYQNTEIISPQFAEHYNKLSTNLNNLDTGYNAVKGTGGLNLIGSFNVAFNSVFTVIVMVWDGIMIYTGMTQNLASDFTFLDKSTVYVTITGIIACITAYLIFIWLSSVSRGKL